MTGPAPRAPAHPTPASAPPGLRRWITLGWLAMSAGAVAAKARRTRGATDPLVHADVIAAVATLLVAAVKAFRLARH